MADLADVVRELYGLTPDAFTVTRNERAADARSNGEKELAASIRSLQKPSMAAWALNLLVRERPDEIGRALEFGQTLRAAQADLDSGALRTLSQQRRSLVAALGKEAATLAKTSGHRISEAAATEIEQTLNAAMTDARAGAALKTGSLTRPLDSVGLEPVDLNNAVAAPDEGLLDATAEDKERPPARIETQKRKLAEARQKALAAARLAEEAASAVAAIARRIDAAARRRDELTTELEDVKSELAALETRISAVDRERKQLEREHDRASRSAEKARAAAEQAQAWG